MNNRIKICVLSGAIFSALMIFLHFYRYKQGNWYLIDSNGDLVSRIGYEKSVGALMIDDEKYYLLTRVNGFDADSIFYRETLFVVNKEGKVIFK
ncbi:hypothetical protein, partial [Butyrivibrio proteoclasticus]|uniref:hypothetical protein n=1 Tax=Butyrivibrio proteoclasticus TaxID=43305 RepID=UPI00054D048C